MITGFNSSTLRDGISNMRIMADLLRRARHQLSGIDRELLKLAEDMKKSPVEQCESAISTLSQLYQEFTLIEPPPQTADESAELKLLRKLLPNDPVTYVEFGAGDPIANSLTWQFYKAGGHGLLVEPRPMKWYRLVMERPRDSHFFDAAGDYDGFAFMRICDGASSVDPTWNVPDNQRFLVKMWRARKILDRHPEIRDNCQLCSLDVEGFERRIMRDIDWSVFRPTVVVAEHAVFDPFDSSASGDRSPEWEHILADRGYVRHTQTRFNTIFVLKPPAKPEPSTQET